MKEKNGLNRNFSCYEFKLCAQRVGGKHGWMARRQGEVMEEIAMIMVAEADREEEEVEEEEE